MGREGRVRFGLGDGGQRHGWALCCGLRDAGELRAALVRPNEDSPYDRPVPVQHRPDGLQPRRGGGAKRRPTRLRHAPEGAQDHRKVPDAHARQVAPR